MLPQKIHQKHGRYYYVHQNRWHPLSRVDEGPARLYERLQEFTGDNPGSLGQIMALYIARAVPELKPASQPEYVRIIENRLQHHFGHMLPDTLEPSHVAQYLELRKREGAPVGGNRERAVLGSVLSWAMRFGWVTRNPCHGVRRNREVPSRRYVTDEELKGVLDRAPDALADLLAVAYLTGLRQGDLRMLRREALTSNGIRLRQSKDGKLREIAWTPALRYFVERATGRSDGPWVFVGPRGRPWTMSGLQSAMRRLGAGFRFRDLRPKAASDAEHNVLGHDAGMLVRYVRAQRLRPVR
ncbi:MAG: tyrosine-type recombinase/integrase [Lautropia sp.]